MLFVAEEHRCFGENDRLPWVSFVTAELYCLLLDREMKAKFAVHTGAWNHDSKRLRKRFKLSFLLAENDTLKPIL